MNQGGAEPGAGSSWRCPECGALASTGAQWTDAAGNSYAGSEPLRLLDSIDTHLTQRVDGSGYAVLEPSSGLVLAHGDAPDAVRAGAVNLAAQLGRRRLQAKIDDGSLAPVKAESAAADGGADGAGVDSLPGLVDQGWRLGSQWQTLHHNGTPFDRAGALEQYQRLQQQLSRAISDPNTPDDQRLRLGVAGLQLFTGANIAGLVPTNPMPPAAFYAALGATGWGGDSAMTGPRAFPGRRMSPRPAETGSSPTGGGNRTVVLMPGERAGTLAARTPRFGGEQTVGATPPPPPGTVLSKAERLSVFNQQLMAAPPARTADEGLALVSSTMNNVEDAHSGVAAEADPGFKYKGRMYPPRADRIDRHADGSLKVTTKGNIIIIKSDGTIGLYEKGPDDSIGKLILNKPGREP